MKIINLCFTCKKEHDVTKLEANAKGLKCECGGYYITPSGKVCTKFIPETEEDYRLLGIKPKVKVWTIKHEHEGMGWTDNETTGFEYELEQEFECDSEQCGYTKDEIKPFVENLKNMETGQEIRLGVWTISCTEMEKEVFENLPEFTGW